jgi:hypothetical protein
MLVYDECSSHIISMVSTSKYLSLRSADEADIRRYVFKALKIEPVLWQYSYTVLILSMSRIHFTLLLQNIVSEHLCSCRATLQKPVKERYSIC